MRWASCDSRWSIHSRRTRASVAASAGSAPTGARQWVSARASAGASSTNSAPARPNARHGPLVRARTRFTFPLCQPRAQLRRRSRDLSSGKRPSTAAGEFVREEMDHIRKGKHGARARRSRRSPSGSPKRGARACRSSRRRGDAPRPAPGARRRSPTRPDRGAGNRARRRPSGSAPAPAPSSANAQPFRAARSPRAEPQREGAPESRLAGQRQEARGRHEGDAASAFERQQARRLDVRASATGAKSHSAGAASPRANCELHPDLTARQVKKVLIAAEMVDVAGPGDPFGLTGSTLAGRYQIECQIGEGGFAVVYPGVSSRA